MPFGESLSDVLKDSSRPSFLFGSTPPREGTSEVKAREACAKFAARSAVLATDGFIVYDIQDEGGRTTLERPFPFRKTMDAAVYASYFPPVSGKQCVVYKSVVESDVASFDKWLDTAINRYGHNAFNFVGAPSSTPSETCLCTLSDAGRQASTQYKGQCSFGCVCIAERHTKKGNEHINMLRKMDAGAEWFITQGIFASGPLVKLLHDYGAVCRERKVVPKKVVLTFAPCGRDKTMHFIKWLGMYVPEEVERRVFASDSPVAESVKLLKEVLVEVLEQSAGSGVPLGINVESLSIFKEEIDAAHELFQSLQALLLKSRGSPWAVRWFDVRRAMSYTAARASEDCLDSYDEHVLSRGGAEAAAAAGTVAAAGGKGGGRERSQLVRGDTVAVGVVALFSGLACGLLLARR